MYRHPIHLCCAAVIGTTILLIGGHAVASVGDFAAVQTLEATYSGPQLDAGAPEAADAIADVVAVAAGMSNEAGQWLLPPGTVVDRAEWLGNVLQIDLTVPQIPRTQWSLSEIDLETLTQAFGTPFANDSAFGGVDVLVRQGASGKYGPLDQFLPIQAKREPPGVVGGETPNVAPATPETLGAETSLGGPTTNADRQPVGALTGVTVYCTGGHGWTADDTAWYLQRPVLLDMCEDYGNIDMLNHFVAYAFNAGATVVPMRPVGWQPIEIVLDQDDPGVTFTGSWSNGTSSKYYENGVTNSGVAYKWTDVSATETATARYTPTITVTDFYPVYCFTIASTNRALQTYRISHSGGVSEVTIDHRDVGNGWIWMGNYYLEAGGDNYVEITNESSDGSVIVADAIRWGDGYGDVSRPGPGTISGYPRDEEAQRYWGESEWGNNAVGFDSGLYDLSGSTDTSDNVGTGARIGAEMNQVPAGGVQVDRWKRIYLEFHTNASSGTARGQMCLINSSYPTTYQTQYATTLSNEVDADLSLIDSEFEHPWYDRSSPTLSGSYGAISTNNNDNEFDATLIELAFHDNQEDAELLRDSRVRAAMARACVQGIIRFLNSQSGGQVPLAFAPDTPRNFSVVDAGVGDVVLSWIAPLSDGARGDPATGYVVYQSSNGYGFGDPIVLGNVLTTTISGVPTGETRYFRIAATNAGGESTPSEVLAVRRPSAGQADILVVNGYDRLRRQINSTQTFTQPPAYAGDTIERQIWRKANEYDYIVQHAEALAANGYGFSSCSNEAVIDQDVPLGGYAVVVWILGRESAEDSTFNAVEQAKVTAFLENGGALFVSGSEIGYDLVGQGNGATFMQNTLRATYSADDAGTYNVTPTAGGIFDGLSGFDFNPANGAPYDTFSPDVLGAGVDALVCLQYSGGGAAGVEYTGGVYNVVTLGFPFETITSSTARTNVMQRVIEFLLTASGPVQFDYDNDGDVDWNDTIGFLFCFLGPDTTYVSGHACLKLDGDGDSDIDMADFTQFQQAFTGPQ